MLPTDEPEILTATRSWDHSQAEFLGIPDPNRPAYGKLCAWYDTSVSEFEGACAMIQSGSALEDLVGDIVRVTYRDKEIFVYVIGGTELPTEIALTRMAWGRLENLSKDEIFVTVRPVVPA
jgi:hypothetical protein